MAIKEVETQAAPKGTQPDTRRSGIAYPYFDLADSVAVAEAIHKRGGGVATADQLAPWIGLPDSRFRRQVRWRGLQGVERRRHLRG